MTMLDAIGPYEILRNLRNVNINLVAKKKGGIVGLQTNWISTLDDIGKQENELALQREKVLDMFRNNENSIRTIFDLAGVNAVLDLPQGNRESSNLHLLNSQEFENNILTFMLTAYATENAHYIPLMESLDAILEQLDAEIKE